MPSETHIEGLEREWRDDVRSALKDLKEEVSAVKTRVNDLATENSEQHAETNGRIDTMVARFEQALTDANKKLAGNATLIRVLAVIIVFLSGMVIGVKAHIADWLKAAGF